MRVLYLSYDGLADHIGQAQVLPYLLGTAAGGHRLTVVSFEKPERMASFGAGIDEQCRAAGIEWRPQRFHSSPPLAAKAIDLAAMRSAAAREARRTAVDLVHCRSYPAAAVGLGLKRRHGVKLLFDMRGFWPDQRREGGRWREGSILGDALYRHWKRREAELIAESDHIVALTAAARDAISIMHSYRGAPISVIPCCADFDLFRPAGEAERCLARTEVGIAGDAPVLVYLGSLGTVYRFDALLRLFRSALVRLPNLKLLFIGSGSAEALVAEAWRLGLPLERHQIRSVAAPRADVPRWICAGDVGLCFCTPGFSSAGVSATKVGEYLACGLPVIGNAQIGDLSRIVEAVGGGLVVPDLSDASIAEAGESVAGLLAADPASIRDRAERFLGLDKAVAAYSQIYDELSRQVSLEP